MTEIELDTASLGKPAMPMGKDCAVHHHVTYVPMEEHHVWPLGMNGPDTDANKVRVCCNGHYEIHEYMRQLILTGGKVPWGEAQHFAFKVRQLAQRGWQEAGSPTHGGGGE